MMQSFLIGFHSVGKASNFQIYLPDGAIFSGLAFIVKILTLALFSASTY